MVKARSALLAVTVLVAGFGLAACSEKRWCEHDATDTRVSDGYCKNNVPGYEWETDGHKKKTKKTKSKKSH